MVAPLDLLTADPERIPSVAEKIWGPALCATLGFGTACFVNWGQRRPVFSGMQFHALLTGSGFIVGQYLDDRRNRYYAERDAVLRRYVELHPEDFPTPERKKYSEVLDPWIPVR